MPGYSSALMDHFQSPRNAGRLDNPDRVGVAGNPAAGPFMVVHFRIHDGIVAAARYQTYGCGPAIAAGSALTELVVGRPIAECLALTAQRVIEVLGGMPPEKEFCAGLAVEALRNGLTGTKNDEATARSM